MNFHPVLQDPEICIVAAVKCDDGYIIRCHRHWLGIQTAEQMKKKLFLGPDQQGFITSRGRYVGRAEGLKLQEEAGIPSKQGNYTCHILFSEDLY